MMATCVAQQSSTQLPPISYRRKFLHSTTCDSRISSKSCRKRLLSEQNDRYIPTMRNSIDRSEIKKKTKTGNCVMSKSTLRTNEKTYDCCFLLCSRSFSHSLSPTFNALPHLIRSFFPTNRVNS
jgi:hypothetical protein